ncbi:SDR family oxidoreductase [Glycomyces tarimensis]
MNQELIAVTGASGKIGRRLVRRLQTEGRAVRELSRGANVRFGWHDRSTWETALTGASAVYLTPPDEPIPADDFVAAAVAAGVRRLVTQSGKRLHLLASALGNEARHSGL